MQHLDLKLRLASGPPGQAAGRCERRDPLSSFLPPPGWSDDRSQL